jgi:N-acetylglucosamine kinase-like BadF-type ATPase
LKAAEAGDEDAKEIATQAGLELSGLVKRAEKVLNRNDYQITFSGGIASASPIVKKAIEQEIGREISLFSGDTAFTAAKLARSDN